MSVQSATKRSFVPIPDEAAYKFGEVVTGGHIGNVAVGVDHSGGPRDEQAALGGGWQADG